MKVAEEYYLGLDMGTSSVGWAVTDSSYEVVKRGGKALWGIRLFEEAETAAGRRQKRVARRRTERRRKRLDLLQELFAEEIARKDPAFFQRLNDSAYHEEDKSIRQTDSLFHDVDFTDKSYHKKYPTIYHLRQALMTESRPFDVRLVYLALHHILKYRGHFLYDDFTIGEEGISNYEPLYQKLQDSIQNVWGEERKFAGVKWKSILLDSHITKRGKADQLTQAAGGTKKDIALYELVKLLAGLKGKLSAVFTDPSLDDTDCKEICFADADYNEKEEKIADALGERYELIEAAKGLYDWSRLGSLLGEAHTLSEAKIKLYDQHRADLKILKQLLKQDPKIYAGMFKKFDKANYSAYVGLCKEKKQKLPKEKTASKEDFYDTVKKTLKKLPDCPAKEEILNRIATGTFMPKSVSTDNGVIPYQLHLMELKKILKQAEAYLPFLLEKDEYGTVSDKIISLMSFRVPYYVGPLNENSPNFWAIKQKGKIYPWNFEEKVDLEKSAEAFIGRLTGKCTYLIGEDVLPANSLLYTKFTVLNALNNIRIGAERKKLDEFQPGLKMRVYEGLFLKQKNVKKKTLITYLTKEGHIDKTIANEIYGMDDAFTDSLAPWIDMQRIFGEGFDVSMAEQMLKDINVFAADKKMLRSRLHHDYPGELPEEKLKDLIRIPAKGWGRLSRKLLTEIYSEKQVDLATGEVMNIITALEKGNKNFMELLARGEGYKEAIDKANEDKLPDTAISYEAIEDMHVSPAVKRPLWQTLRIVKEITKIMGKPPARIFIEMAKSPDEKKQRTKSRKEKLLELYKSCKKEEPELFARLSKETDESLRSDKLYLYYTQLGKSMYSGKPISLDDLTNQNRYDVDHIYPQSVTGDDSLDNRVLVEKVLNSKKGNTYPLGDALNGYRNAKEGIAIDDIRKEQGPFWAMLCQQGLISKEKYSRLTRNTPFTNDEKAVFIGRQLVETRQSTKAAAEILKRAYPDTEIVYAKARNASQFRQYAGFIKVRDLNDYHHAKDAYLNIVVGNVFYTKFTSNPVNFLREKSPVYSLNPEALYAHRISRGDKVAWVPGDDGTMVTVRKWMRKNNILFTRMTFIGKGKLFDENVLKKGKGQVSLKNGTALSDISKYGGYNNASAGYFVLLKVSDKKGKMGFRLVTVPIYLMKQLETDEAKKAYFQDKLGVGKNALKVIAVVISRIPIQSLFNINGFYANLAGKNGEGFLLRNAMQLCLSENDEIVLKQILKFNVRYKQHASSVTSHDGITAEQNLMLYRTFVEKLKKTVYGKKLSKQANVLENGLPLFTEMPLEAQCHLLGEVLHLFQCNPVASDLRSIGGGGRAGLLTMSATVQEKDRIYWVVQSVTGFFEKKIPLWPGDE